MPYASQFKINVGLDGVQIKFTNQFDAESPIESVCDIAMTRSCAMSLKDVLDRLLSTELPKVQ